MKKISNLSTGVQQEHTRKTTFLSLNTDILRHLNSFLPPQDSVSLAKTSPTASQSIANTARMRANRLLLFAEKKISRNFLFLTLRRSSRESDIEAYAALLRNKDTPPPQRPYIYDHLCSRLETVGSEELPNKMLILGKFFADKPKNTIHEYERDFIEPLQAVYDPMKRARASIGRGRAFASLSPTDQAAEIIIRNEGEDSYAHWMLREQLSENHSFSSFPDGIKIMLRNGEPSFSQVFGNPAIHFSQNDDLQQALKKEIAKRISTERYRSDFADFLLNPVGRETNKIRDITYGIRNVGDHNRDEQLKPKISQIKAILENLEQHIGRHPELHNAAVSLRKINKIVNKIKGKATFNAISTNMKFQRAMTNIDGDLQSLQRRYAIKEDKAKSAAIIGQAFAFKGLQEKREKLSLYQQDFVEAVDRWRGDETQFARGILARGIAFQGLPENERTLERYQRDFSDATNLLNNPLAKSYAKRGQASAFNGLPPPLRTTALYQRDFVEPFTDARNVEVRANLIRASGEAFQGIPDTERTMDLYRDSFLEPMKSIPMYTYISTGRHAHAVVSKHHAEAMCGQITALNSMSGKETDQLYYDFYQNAQIVKRDDPAFAEILRQCDGGSCEKVLGHFPLGSHITREKSKIEKFLLKIGGILNSMSESGYNRGRRTAKTIRFPMQPLKILRNGPGYDGDSSNDVSKAHKTNDPLNPKSTDTRGMRSQKREGSFRGPQQQIVTRFRGR